MTVTVLPSIEAASIRWLKSRSEVTAICAATSISPKYGDTQPWVHVVRTGGVPPMSRPLVMDTAAVQFDVYGNTKNQARLLADTVRAVLAVWPDQQTDNALFVLRVVLGNLQWLPDEVTSQDPAPRYIVNASVTFKNR